MTERELWEFLKEAEIPFEFATKKNAVCGLEWAVKIELSDLADLINNYFLPRPLFEDGTPVKVGDEFALHKPSERKKVTNFCVSNDGIFSINSFVYDQDQRVMKPKQPEALDADGVAIKAGDKIYFSAGDDTPLKCIGFDYDGDVIFTDWEETGTIAYENATVFTHKKPDSWEQLEEDVMLTPYYYCDRRDIKAEIGFASESKAKDVVRRAKALAGVCDE